MKFCDCEECEMVACCNHCVNMITTSEYRFICSLDGEEVHPMAICDEFDCFRNYRKEEK